jgi:ceramide glucosyltransferase
VFIGLAAHWLLPLVAVAGIAYTALAALLVRSRHAAATIRRNRLPPVTLLKPLCGAEPGLEEDLRSFFEQHYDGPLQILLGVHSRSDPALAIVEKLVREYPAVRADVVIDGSSRGRNPKISNLINMFPTATGDVLLLSDSDIRVPAHYATSLVREIFSPGVGAVTCLYHGHAIGGLWVRLEAMGIDYGFLPNALTGTVLGLAAPCFGATIGLRRGTLAEIGGFEALSQHLADDYELGRAVRAKGYAVKLSSLVLQHRCSERSFRGLFRHELRWARTIRLLNSTGYAGSVVTYPVPLALLALWPLGFGSTQGLTLLAAAVLVRLALAWRIRDGLGARSGPLWLLPLRDVLSFIIFFASFLGNSVYWRGTRYETEAHGLLAQQ